MTLSPAAAQWLDNFTFSDCWEGIFTFHKCCRIEAGLYGDPGCWSQDYDFERCCGYDPTEAFDLLSRLHKMILLVSKGQLDGEQAERLCGDIVARPQGSPNLEAAFTRHAWRSYALALAAGRVVEDIAVERESAAVADLSACSLSRLSQRHPHKHNVDIAANRVHVLLSRAHTDPVPRSLLAAKQAAHVSRCASTAGLACPLYNPWRPDACLEHHPLVQPWQPGCGGAMAAAVRDEKLSGSNDALVVDWLGVRLARDSCDARGPLVQVELTRLLECSGPNPDLGLMMGEDYFESISLLRGVADASGSFTVIELGSAWGYWSVKAAVAWRRSRQRDRGPCHIALVEADADMLGQAPAHLTRNRVLSFCNATLLNANATGALLDRLVAGFDSVDLLHVDVQGAELPLLRDSRLLRRVRRLHVATHSRSIHRELRSLLRMKGLIFEFDFGHRSFTDTPFGPVPIDDGMLAGTFHPEPGSSA